MGSLDTFNSDINEVISNPIPIFGFYSISRYHFSTNFSFIIIDLIKLALTESYVAHVLE